MEKGDENLEQAKQKSEKIEGDVTLLKQLVDSLDDSEKKLEEFYKKNDPENMNKVKKFMIDIAGKISEIIK